MKLFQEITKWPDSTTPNHAYYMDNSKSKMYAYIQAGHRAVFEFKKPIRIDIRGRKFQEIADPVGFSPREADVVQTRTWTVTGSRGDTYTVQELEGVLQCSCSGFRFRGTCKHVNKIGEQNGS
jgi:hypothetical protein